MRIIVTCGPSYEPIDGARRMTNMSTGKLGVTLANFLTDSDHEVICFRGEDSTYPGVVRAARLEPFATNDELAQRLIQTDACVLNGAAYGEGFAICHAGGRVQKCSDTPALCKMLVELLYFPTSAASAPAPFSPADSN